MRVVRYFAAIPGILVLCGVSCMAQRSATGFRPGKWEIDSVTTASDGRTVSSTTYVCAQEQLDFWKVVQPGLDCKPPKVHPATQGGVHVEVICIYNLDALHSEIDSNVIEKLSRNGNSFTAVGTQTTNTVYQGVRPSVNSVQLQSTAHRTGECD